MTKNDTKRTIKAPNQKEVKSYLEMMGEITYGDRLEMLRTLSDSNHPEDMRILKKYEELVKEKGANTPFPG